MAEIFEHGYAVIVGVDSNKIGQLALPTVAKDVQAVYEVLVHPERCAYREENVKLLKGEDSTSKNILEALYWLKDKVKEDPEATAVIYYSGHGMVDKETNQYYLIPYDIQALSRIRIDAIKAEALTAEIGSVRARRMLAILDCCHAGGMDVKDVDLAAIDEDVNVEAAAFPADLLKPKGAALDTAESGSKAVSDLLAGDGRAVLNSSTGAQSSYIRKDGRMSLFTYHLIEALTGHAPHPDDAKVVLVTDVMSWVTHEVKKSAEKEGRNQTPVMGTSGVFPVAQLIGGAGLSKGVGQIPPDPLEPLPAAGTTFNQQGQTVHGSQVNAGGNVEIGQLGNNINTGGGTYIGGGVNTGGGEFVGRDKVVQGDEVRGDKFGGDKVMGDKAERDMYKGINVPGSGPVSFGGDAVSGDQVGGDKISAGDISGTGVAIGRGASANVQIQQGLSGNELNQLFAPLLSAVAQHDPTAVAKVQALKAEAGRGEEADDEKIADLIGDIADAVPSVVEMLAGLFTNSVVAKAAGGATKYILKRIRK